MEYAGFTKGTSAFAGLETWKSTGLDIDFILDPTDPELLEFWRYEFPDLYEFLANEWERVQYIPEECCLLVKI
jgi:hypothetical protein